MPFAELFRSAASPLCRYLSVSFWEIGSIRFWASSLVKAYRFYFLFIRNFLPRLAPFHKSFREWPGHLVSVLGIYFSLVSEEKLFCFGEIGINDSK